MSNTVTISGRVVADPELRHIPSGTALLEFPLYDNEQRKNRDTGVYEDTGNTLKLRVTIWGDEAVAAHESIRRGDVVEITGSITEKEFTKKDGTAGRALETTFVNSWVVKWQKPDEGGDVPQGQNNWVPDQSAAAKSPF